MELTNPVHDALITELDRLSRRHLLYFRVEVGRTVAAHLYGGDPVEMQDQLGRRTGALKDFATARAQELEDRGLSEQLLRRSLAAWGVVIALPTPIVDQLVFAHVDALARVEDPQAREHLALAAVNNAWSSRKLVDAIRAIERDRWIDAKPEEPGMQPPPAPAEPSRGRLVQRFEKTARDVADVVAAFESIRVEELSDLERERAREALALVMERAASLMEKLG